MRNTLRYFLLSLVIVFFQVSAFTMPKPKFYAVAVGRKPGIYTSWDDCKDQTQGFKAAKFKSFPTKSEAQKFIDELSIKQDDVNAEVQPPPPGKRQKKAAIYICSVFIHFDGGSRGNPGIGGAGAQVVVSTKAMHNTKAPIEEQIIHVRKFLGTVTNNQAEYQGLVAGLEEAHKQLQSFQAQHIGMPLESIIHVRGDSDLIIKQMKGEYEVKNQKLIGLHQTAKKVVADIRRIMPLEIKYEHIYREANSIADSLGNEAMDSQKSWTNVVSRRNTSSGDDVARSLHASCDDDQGVDV